MKITFTIFLNLFLIFFCAAQKQVRIKVINENSIQLQGIQIAAEWREGSGRILFSGETNYRGIYEVEISQEDYDIDPKNVITIFYKRLNEQQQKQYFTLEELVASSENVIIYNENLNSNGEQAIKIKALEQKIIKQEATISILEQKLKNSKTRKEIVVKLQREKDSISQVLIENKIIITTLRGVARDLGVENAKLTEENSDLSANFRYVNRKLAKQFRISNVSNFINSKDKDQLTFSFLIESKGQSEFVEPGTLSVPVEIEIIRTNNMSLNEGKSTTRILHNGEKRYRFNGTLGNESSITFVGNRKDFRFGRYHYVINFYDENNDLVAHYPIINLKEKIENSKQNTSKETMTVFYVKSLNNLELKINDPINFGNTTNLTVIVNSKTIVLNQITSAKEILIPLKKGYLNLSGDNIIYLKGKPLRNSKEIELAVSLNGEEKLIVVTPNVTSVIKVKLISD